MWLQLWTPRTEGCGEIHWPHRRVGPEDHFDVVVEVHRKVDLTGITVGRAAHAAEIGMSFADPPAGWAKQIPRHVKNPRPGGAQEHFQDRAAVHVPVICQGVGPDALERQFIRPFQKFFEALGKGSIRPLMDHRLP
jgi:hypothetical protein